MSKKKSNEKHTANSKFAWVTYNKQLTSSYRLLKKLLTFLSEKAYFASWHECCRYIRQLTKHMHKNSENAYTYHVKLILALMGVYSASSFNN